MMTNRANAICLLQILREYSDEEHILTMREITEKMRVLYDLEVDRRTVYSAVELLQELGYDISGFAENQKGYYLRGRPFELSEVRLLMDAVYSFEYIPPKQTEYLIRKLQGLLSVHARRQYRHLTVVRPERKTPNGQVFLNIELLDEAIAQKKKVAFTYLTYGIDKRLHPRRAEKTVGDPYGMVCENEHYYLILRWKKYELPSLFRIDLMKDLEILPEPIDRAAEDANLDAVSKVTYAYVGKPEPIRLRCADFTLKYVLDKFGLDVQITPNDDDTFDARFTAAPKGVQYWAQQYLQYVEVLEPAHLRESVMQAIRENVYHL